MHDGMARAHDDIIVIAMTVMSSCTLDHSDHNHVVRIFILHSYV